MRRNLLIAQTIAGFPMQASVLLVAGARDANAFAMPPGVDCLTLPALRKGVDGHYHSRSLDTSLSELIALRGKTMRAAIEAFEPDVLIVDKVPRGAFGELEPTLECLRAHGHTRCVLGLRDVLDDPVTVRHEWGREANEDAIREYYHALWVYGDPAVYDLVRQYHWSPDIAAKVRYTGYLDQRIRLASAAGEGTETCADLGLPPGRLALCLVGGGQDGTHLAEAFAQVEFPPDTHGVVLTGRFMPPEVRERLYRCAAMRPRLQVLDFVSEPTLLLPHADRIVAMGGYNTVCEVLSFDKHALIVPRVRPRLEQHIRAEKLRNLGLLDMLHPDEATPGALADWLARDLGPSPRVRDRIDMNGPVRLPGLLEEMLVSPTLPTCSPIYVKETAACRSLSLCALATS